MPQESVTTDETHNENDDGNPPVNQQNIHDLTIAISVSRKQMDG